MVQAEKERRAYTPLTSVEYESSDSDPEALPAGHPHSVWRFAKPFSFVALISLVATVGLLYHRGSAAYLNSSSINGFVNYESAPVSPWIKPKPLICNEAIVMDICLRLKAMTAADLTGRVNLASHKVHVTTLADHFMVSKQSILDFIHNIGANKVEVGDAEFAVQCQDICEKTVASFPPNLLPEMVDVGCYYYTELDKLPVCSVDLSLASLQKDLKVDHKVDHADDAFLANRPVKLSEEQKDFKEKFFADGPHLHDVTGGIHHPDVTYGHLQLQFANLFRVYPAPRHLITKENLDQTERHESLETARKLKFEPPKGKKKPDDSCSFSKDGTCDVPGSCVDGTDCTDCGTCEGEIYDDSCQYSKNGVCDEEHWCLRGTDCTDCDTCEDHHSQTSHDDSCKNANDGHCDDGLTCEAGTDCSDCSNCKTGGQHMQPGQWPIMVLQTGVKAYAMASIALTALGAGDGKEVLEKWIGVDNAQIRTLLKSTVSRLHRTLQTVDYTFPGQRCEKATYAYVDPLEPPTPAGEFDFHLCKLFMNSNQKIQLSVIFHQGVKLGDVMLDSVELDGQDVYGFDMVKKLAAKCAAGDPKMCKHAARSSETVMYIIEDLARLDV